MNATLACGSVATGSAGVAGAVGWVASAVLTLPGLPVISVVGARAVGGAGCGVVPQGAGTVAEIRVAGMPIDIAPGPNAKLVLVDKGPVTVAVVIDERVPVGNGIVVNAARVVIRMPRNNADIVLGQATSAVTNCFTA